MARAAPRANLQRRYRKVPAELVAALERFRAGHPAKQVRVGGVGWSYLEAGAGPSVVLLLGGATGQAEMSWRSIDHLAARHRVIAPDYPALDAMSALADGLAALLDELGIESAHVTGGSYGGLVAQAFVRRHPGRTQSLALSHTRLPDPASTAQMAKALRWMERLPQGFLRGLFRLRLAKLFPKHGPPEVALSKAHFGELVGRLTKADIIALMRRVADLGLSFHFAPGDLGAWPGRILLVLADDDPATPEAAREAMKAMYPRAEVRTFSGGGHLTVLLRQDEYFAVLDEFLGSADRELGTALRCC